jgi:U3 small nucleolar RNA-associated protein 4
MIELLQTLSGPYPSKVDTLTFTLRHPENLSPGDVPVLSDLRLFSTGGGSELLEWDLSKCCVRVSTSSVHTSRIRDTHSGSQEDNKL